MIQFPYVNRHMGGSMSEERQWNLSELGKLTGISKSHISRVLRGQRDPSTTVLVKLARVMKMSTDDLIRHIQREKRRIKMGSL